MIQGDNPENSMLRADRVVKTARENANDCEC